MEWKTYTADECNRYISATGILGEVISRCAELSYNTNDEDIQDAILEFETPYAIWRTNLRMANTEDIDRVYKEVKPLIKGKITIDYILQHVGVLQPA